MNPCAQKHLLVLLNCKIYKIKHFCSHDFTGAPATSCGSMAAVTSQSRLVCRSAFPLPLFKALPCSFLLETLVAFVSFRFKRLVLFVQFKFLLLGPKLILSATFLCSKSLSCWLHFFPKCFLSIFGLLPSSSCLDF